MSLGRLPVAPDSIRVQLKYVEEVSVNTTVTDYGTYVFRLNDLYDPNYTSTGHQPTGFDQWMSIYNRFRVDKVRVRVTASPTSTYVSDKWTMTLSPQSSTTSTTSIQSTAEDPRSKTVLVSAYQHGTIENVFDLRRLFGVSKELYGSSNYTGTGTSSPNSIYYLHIFVSGWNITPTSGYCVLLVELEFDCLIYERLNVAPSLSSFSNVKTSTLHPATCRCVDCTKRKLDEFERSAQSK